MSAREDFSFANDVRAAIQDRGARLGWLQLIIITIIFAGAAGWASYATLEEVTSGEARVIPSSQIQVVQSLEAGIVREILISEGDQVEQGQVLVRVDDTSVTSELGELNQRRYALAAEAARLHAESIGGTEMSVDEELRKAAPGRVAAEEANFQARQKLRADQIALLEQQLFQREQELTELQARQHKLELTRAPLAREVELTRKLRKRGVVPEIDMLRLERQLAEVDGDISLAAASLPRLQASIEEAQQRIRNVGAEAIAEAGERLARVNADIAILDESERAAKERVRRANLTSPVRGVINKLGVRSIGAVVQPGLDVVEIVPLDDTLLIEVQVRPKDVAFIAPGQEATVKLSAYDYLTYGSLDGVVERIGADTVRDGRGEAFYKVTVKTDARYEDANGAELPIIPGMIGSVDIQTGERTVLQYLLKPFNRVRHEAFRER